MVLDERVEGCGGGVAAAIDGGEAVEATTRQRSPARPARTLPSVPPPGCTG
jgi:hypothetical protein